MDGLTYLRVLELAKFMQTHFVNRKDLTGPQHALDKAEPAHGFFDSIIQDELVNFRQHYSHMSQRLLL